MDKKHFVYILLTENNTYYCGYTDNVEKRFQTHLNGKGAKYTKSNKPIKIVYQKEFKTKSEAMKEEYRIKQLSKAEKRGLINCGHNTNLKTFNIQKFLNIKNAVILTIITLFLLGIIAIIQAGIRGFSGNII